MFLHLLVSLGLFVGVVFSACVDTNWVQHGTSCYYFSTSILPWDAAQDYCQEFGGYLAEITSSTENTYLQSEAKKRYRHATLHGVTVWGYWTGGKEVNHQWTWGNSGAKMTYTHWAPGEPNSAAESCVHLPYHENFAWNDYVCKMSEYFICESTA